MDIRELITLSKLTGPEEAELFETFRRQAFREASSTFDDRAISYNVDHMPTEEMPYGIVSLASEVYKRTIRMTSLTSPMRIDPVRAEDIARLEDTCIDVINYASWMYALVQIVMQKLSDQRPPELEPEPPTSVHKLESFFSRGGADLRPMNEPQLVAGGRLEPRRPHKWITSHSYLHDEGQGVLAGLCTYFEDSSPGGTICGHPRGEHAE